MDDKSMRLNIKNAESSNDYKLATLATKAKPEIFSNTLGDATKVMHYATEYSPAYLPSE